MSQTFWRIVHLWWKWKLIYCESEFQWNGSMTTFLIISLLVIVVENIVVINFIPRKRQTSKVKSSPKWKSATTSWNGDEENDDWLRFDFSLSARQWPHCLLNTCVMLHCCTAAVWHHGSAAFRSNYMTVLDERMQCCVAEKLLKRATIQTIWSIAV